MNETTTRDQHLDWCKQRALKYCDAGDLRQALASMMSDLQKHPETKNHPARVLGMQLFVSGNLNDTAEMRKFIEGFN